MKHDIKEYTVEEFENLLQKYGLPKYAAKQLFSWVYKKRVKSFEAMTDLSRASRRFFYDNFYFSKLEPAQKQISRDKTEKFLFTLNDRSNIETVFIPEEKRGTLCLSTQVGCKFNCAFCVSGKSGFKRNLSCSEIVNQFLHVSDFHKITNIVFMGIGEPLDNFDNTVKSVRIFTESAGINLGRTKISLSTSGIVARMRELAKLDLGIKLSVSLHSANNQTRSKLMPVNKKYPLSELIKAVKEFGKGRRNAVTFEYVLIHGVNSSRQDAGELAGLLRRMKCKVNLISYNASFLGFKAPLEEEIKEFGEELKKRNIFFTFRKSRGEDIAAACGQLSIYTAAK